MDWEVFADLDNGEKILYRNTLSAFVLRFPNGQVCEIGSKALSDLGKFLNTPCLNCSTGRLEWLVVTRLPVLALACGTCEREHVLAGDEMCLLD